MLKRFILMTLFLVITFGGIFGFKFYMGMKMGKMMMAAEPPPVVVTAMEAFEEEWTQSITSIGSLVASQSVGISTEILGRISKINFESGQIVKEGDVLVRLDDSVEQAELKSLITMSALSSTELKRGEELIKLKLISQNEYDRLKAKYEDYQSKIVAQKAIIEKKTIKAPFSGVLGIKKVDVGQLLVPGSEIVTLQNFDPIYVDFTLPQHYIAKISQGQEIALRVDAYPNEEFRGKIATIESKVDENIRSFKVRGTVSNGDLRLKPGMFVHVDIEMPQKKKVISLPNTSISYAPYGNSVFVIKEEGKDKDGKPILKAFNRIIKTGERMGDKVEILSGVSKGEIVVTAGHIKLKGGEKVVIDNTIQPDNNPKPHPPNS